MKKGVQRTFNFSKWVFFALLLIMLWPLQLGGIFGPIIVNGTSMEPTLYSGDIVIIRRSAPKIGDIVAYKPFEDKNALILHRIIDHKEDLWILQGDNNAWVDPFNPSTKDIQGVMMARIPVIGHLFFFLTSAWMWPSLALLALAIYIWPSSQNTEDSISKDESV